MNTALSTNWDFRVSCGPDMHALSPRAATLNHRATLEKADRKSAERERCWSFLNPPARGSGSGFSMPRTSPGCQLDVRFLTCRLAVPSSEYTTATPVQWDVAPESCGDQHDYARSAHNHSHWWCTRSINQISQSGAQSASDQYNPPACRLTVALSPRVSFCSTSPHLCLQVIMLQYKLLLVRRASVAIAFWDERHSW